MFTCWKCNKELPDSATTCPECNFNVTKKVVDNMMTIGPGGGPTSQILPGVLVANRYKIKQEIGRGGMGIVYLAHDKTMKHDVAKKIGLLQEDTIYALYKIIPLVKNGPYDRILEKY